MKRRADFLRAAKGRRVHDAAFTLQAGRRSPEVVETVGVEPRIGFTVTKKVGNAVERNRIRRRLREIVRLSEALSTERETDYVVVARREAITTPFAHLMSAIEEAVRRAGRRSGPGRGKAPARQV